MVSVASDLDIVLQPYGAFISRRQINRFDVLNRSATAMLLRVLVDSAELQRMDTQLVEILSRKGYLLYVDASPSSPQITEQPAVGFISERDVLKATRAEIEVTNRCNLKCKYCYAEVNKSKTELSLEEWKTLLSGMKDHGLRAVLLSGGEPFIRDDIVDLISWASSRFIVEVNSNGYYITEDVAKKLGELNLKVVQISLDSADSEYHDSVRGKGSHKVAVEAIEHLVRNRVKVQISCVVTKSNASGISELKSFADELGVVFKADPITRTGSAQNIEDAEWDHKFQASSKSRVEPALSENDPSMFTPVCQSQVGYVAVSHGGLLKPCNMREGFFEPVGSDLFCEHDSSWWNRFYGESRLGGIGISRGVTTNEYFPYVDASGRYICSMQSLYMKLDKKSGRNKAGDIQK